MTKHRPHKPKHAPARAARAGAKWFSLHAAPDVSPGERVLWIRIAWGVLGLLAIVIGWYAARFHHVGDAFTETDFYGAYADGARMIQHGRVDPSRYGVIGPVYEFVLALVGFVVRDLFVAAEAISLVSIVAGAWCWFALIERRFDARTALLALLVIVTRPTVFRYGYSVTTDALAFALQAGVLLLLLTRSGRRSAWWAGVLAAVTFLTRYNAVYLLPAGLMVLLFAATPRGRDGRATLAFAAGFAAPVVPWILFSLTSGQSFSFQLHHNIAYDVFAKAKGIPWDRYQETMQSQFPTLWSVIARDPLAVVRRELFNVWDHLQRDAVQLVGWPIALFAAVGLVVAWRDGRLGRAWPILLAAALLFLTLVPAFYSERYSLPLIPAWALFAALPFASARFAFSIGGPRGVWLKLAVFALPIALALPATAEYQRYQTSQLPNEVLEASRVLAEQARPGDRLVARKPHIGYHSGVELLPFPFAKSLPQLGEFAREHKVRWLYYSWLEAELRPDFTFLLDTTAHVPGLTVRFATLKHPAVLYEIGPELGQAPDWFARDTMIAVHNARARLLYQPRDTLVLYNLAIIERAIGNLDRARDLAVRAATLAPGDIRYHLLVGAISLRLQDPDMADAAFSQAQMLNPASVEAQIGRGWASLMAEHLEDAANHWRPVVAATHDPATLQQMALLYRRLGDTAAEAEARAGLARVGADP